MPPPLTPLILPSARMLPRILAVCRGERREKYLREIEKAQHNFFHLDIVYGVFKGIMLPFFFPSDVLYIF